MKTAVTILFLLLAGLGNLPAQTPHDPAEAELIAAIDRSASAIRSLQCDFTQTKELSLLQDKMVSRGVMYYRQEGGKLHWEYLSPYTYTFVLNGDRVMMRSSGHTDVVETSGNRMFRQIARIMMHSLTGRSLSQEAEFDTQVRAEDGRCPDIVLCSRFMEGSAEYPVSATKKLAYGFFRWMIKISTGRKIADPTTGLQGLNRRAFLYYSKYKHFDDKYPDANMIIQMQLLGFRIDEIPAVMHARSCGTSMHSGLKPVVYMFRMVFSIIGVVFRIKVLGIDAGAGERDVFMDKKE